MLEVLAYALFHTSIFPVYREALRQVGGLRQKADFVPPSLESVVRLCVTEDTDRRFHQRSHLMRIPLPESVARGPLAKDYFTVIALMACPLHDHLSTDAGAVNAAVVGRPKESETSSLRYLNKSDLENLALT